MLLQSLRCYARPCDPFLLSRGLTLALGFLLSSASCVAPADAPLEMEDDPQSSALPLVSSVDCTPRTETAYRSGRPYPIDVITIGGKPMTKATGHAFLRMQREADQAGVYLGLTSGFRTNAEQTYLYNCYVSGSCNNGNLAAYPGYSNHQSGVAVDLTTSSWLAANASRFGFARTVPSEPWHYEYTGSDPGGPCSSATFLSPKEGGWYKNGIWFKVATSSEAAKVRYTAGSYLLGESGDAANSFPVRYTFNTLGERSVTATVLSANGKTIAATTVRFRIAD